MTTQVLLVTGGLRKHRSRLASTEMLSLTPGSGWREVSSARLPRPMSYFHVIALGDRILLFGEWLHDPFKKFKSHDLITGGHDGDKGTFHHDDILDFSKETLAWTKIGILENGRYRHAVSVVNYSDFKKFC